MKYEITIIFRVTEKRGASEEHGQHEDNNMHQQHCQSTSPHTYVDFSGLQRSKIDSDFILISIFRKRFLIFGKIQQTFVEDETCIMLFFETPKNEVPLGKETMCNSQCCARQRFGVNVDAISSSCLQRRTS